MNGTISNNDISLFTSIISSKSVETTTSSTPPTLDKKSRPEQRLIRKFTRHHDTHKRALFEDTVLLHDAGSSASSRGIDPSPVDHSGSSNFAGNGREITGTDPAIIIWDYLPLLERALMPRPAGIGLFRLL
ncbi:unnamed protein product [Adineta ricciae]|uniref:Uncharacterized protein n=1 Tax=Adineta ricciae TaxID=249248 RepID=A0A815W0W6_ADIRI|nr:unnamed protein product [Adineta ricciae]